MILLLSNFFSIKTICYIKRLVFLVMSLAFLGCPSVDKLPFDRSHSIILTNDMGTHDVFQAEFALALASRGDIRLLGIVAEKVWRGVSISNDFENDAYGDLCDMARRSGMVNIPPVKLGFIYGETWTLQRPVSGSVEDTVPIDSPGAAFILDQVLNRSNEKPIVICTGGQVTSIASAYLMAIRKGKGQEFVEGVIVAGNLAQPKKGRSTLRYFNFYTDPWAGFVVMKRLKTVIPNQKHGLKAYGTAERHMIKSKMPESELQRFMFDKDLTNEWLPGNAIGDDGALLLVLFPEKGTFFESAKRMQLLDRWETAWEKPWFPSGMTLSPTIENDRKGNIIVATTKYDNPAVKNAFIDVLSDPLTYKGRTIQQAPYLGRPATLDGKIEAEAFDFGQEGRAYHDEAFSESKPYSASKLRQLERPDLELSTDPAGPGVQLAYLGNSEWLEYTVMAPKNGNYKVTARVASEAKSQFRLEFRNPETDAVLLVSPVVNVPDTNGFDNWIDVPVPGIKLDKGIYVMRFVHTGRIKRYEAEALPYQSTGTIEFLSSPDASNGGAHLLKASNSEASITYKMPVSKGRYRVIVGYRGGDANGWMQLLIDDVIQSNPAGSKFFIDQYIWRPYWRTFEFGTSTYDESGFKAFKFKVPNKNPLSKGWNLIIDYLELQPEGPFKVNYFSFTPPPG